MSGPTMVTMARIKRIFDDMKLVYDVDADGDLRLGWDNAQLYVIVEESRARMNAGWRGRPSNPEDLAKITEMVVDCNSNRVGPKAAILEGEEGSIVTAECAVYSTTGLSDEQLENWVNVSVEMCMGFLMEVEEVMPHLVTWDEEED
ncbi:MAG: YbjN domain-containing protein [Actinomycetaceae bacterium]|nr:YbjN domain-containing protein [Actinomycetaceae bacterium]